jgi:hypothetical protein
MSICLGCAFLDQCCPGVVPTKQSLGLKWRNSTEGRGGEVLSGAQNSHIDAPCQKFLAGVMKEYEMYGQNTCGVGCCFIYVPWYVNHMNISTGERLVREEILFILFLFLFYFIWIFNVPERETKGGKNLQERRGGWKTESTCIYIYMCIHTHSGHSPRRNRAHELRPGGHTRAREGKVARSVLILLILIFYSTSLLDFLTHITANSFSYFTRLPYSTSFSV